MKHKVFAIGFMMFLASFASLSFVQAQTAGGAGIVANEDDAAALAELTASSTPKTTTNSVSCETLCENKQIIGELDSAGVASCKEDCYPCLKTYSKSIASAQDTKTYCINRYNQATSKEKISLPNPTVCEDIYSKAASAASETKKSCENPTTKQAAPGDETSMGITMGPTCLKNGQCGFNIYELLGINRSSSATLFVQDILLSATFFIGTILTIAFLYSGFMFVMAGATGKDPSSAKNGIKYSIIGLLIVVTSYSLIRLIQYIAKGL